MCLIFLSINNHSNYKLILAGNRDEFYNRKTASANFWTDHGQVLEVVTLKPVVRGLP